MKMSIKFCLCMLLVSFKMIYCQEPRDQFVQQQECVVNGEKSVSPISEPINLDTIPVSKVEESKFSIKEGRAHLAVYKEKQRQDFIASLYNYLADITTRIEDIGSVDIAQKLVLNDSYFQDLLKKDGDPSETLADVGNYALKQQNKGVAIFVRALQKSAEPPASLLEGDLDKKTISEGYFIVCECVKKQRDKDADKTVSQNLEKLRNHYQIAAGKKNFYSELLEFARKKDNPLAFEYIQTFVDRNGSISNILAPVVIWGGGGIMLYQITSRIRQAPR